MPRNIKLFLVLCVLFALWRLYWNFSFALTPSQHWQDLLSSLTTAERQVTLHGALSAALTQTAYYLIPAAFFALFAGFGGHNWARWGFVAVLVLLEVFPLVYAGYSLVLNPQLYHVIHHPILDWLGTYRLDAAHWAVWVRVALKLSLFALLFSKNAEPWFHRARHPAVPMGAVHA